MHIHYWKGALPLVLISTLLINYSPVSAQAQTSQTSSWFKPEAPKIRLIKGNLTLSTFPTNSDKGCTPNTKFVTVPKDVVRGKEEKSQIGCAIQTTYGIYDSSSGLITLTGTNVAGKLQTSNGSSLAVTPIANTDNIAYLNSTEPLYGSYRYIIKDFSKKIETIVQKDGSVIHKLKPGVVGEGIKDANGSLINFSNGRFSSNGAWMVGNAHMRGLYRVNIVTGETIIYGGGYNHAIGMSPNFVSAVTSDGRYAIDTENIYDIFTIYDYNTCKTNPDQLKPATCQSRFLRRDIQAQVPNFKRVHYVEFSTNYSLRLYILHTDGSYGYYVMTAVDEQESTLDYLALGDSFASGEGTDNYREQTAIRNVNDCHLSPISYPHLITPRTTFNTVQSVACSGAKMKDIFNPDYPEGIAQAKGKNESRYNEEIYTNYLPGYRPQGDFIERTKPKKITISIGGNDIGFGNILAACIKPGVCYKDPQERLNIGHTITSQYDQLVRTYEKVKQSAQTDADIYIIGYPSLAKSGGNCALNVLLENEEIQISNEIISYMNLVSQRAAQAAGVSYVDVMDAFNGYRLCETDREDTAVNGVMTGNDKTHSFELGDTTITFYLTSKGSYHPNKKGHRLLADAILANTNSLNTKSPSPKVVTAPTLNEAGLLNTGFNLVAHKIFFDDTITNNILGFDTVQPLNIQGLLPNSNITIQIDTTIIGTYKSNDTGEIHEYFPISKSIPSGIQTIHAVGKNKTGEAVDIQKNIYLAAARDDFDGDSVPNNREICLLIDIPGSCTGSDTIRSNDTITKSVPAVAQYPSNNPTTAQQHSLMDTGIVGRTLEAITSKVLGYSSNSKPGSINNRPLPGQSIGRKLITLALTMGVITLFCIYTARYIWRKRLQ